MSWFFKITAPISIGYCMALHEYRLGINPKVALPPIFKK
jgi:hypothetical protein